MSQAETNDEKKAASPIKRKILKAISIGTWGAVIWTLFGYLGYWLNLTKLSPSIISKVFFKDNFIFQWQGIIVSVFIFICLSILVSVIYVFLFSHIYTPWIGIIFGCVIWYGIIGWRKLELNTIFTTMSLFALYGAFIGYSLSVEFSSLEKKK